jgi:S-DNA-T family DNA segregation ATPase FtsK/SpoIIIE
MATRPFCPKASPDEFLGEGTLPHSEPVSVVQRRGREVAAFLLFAAAVFLLLALLTYRRELNDPSVEGPNWVGPVGETVASWLVQGFGCVALLAPLELGLVGFPLFRGREVGPWGLRVAGDLIVAIVASAIVQVLWPEATSFGSMSASGNVGTLFGELMRGMFSTLGSLLVGMTMIGLVLLGRSAFSFIELCQRTYDGAVRFMRWLRHLFARVLGAWFEARRLNRASRMTTPPAPVIVTTHLSEQAIIDELSPDKDYASVEHTGAPPVAVLSSLRGGLVAGAGMLSETETPLAAPVTVRFVTTEAATQSPSAIAEPSKAKIVLRQPKDEEVHEDDDEEVDEDEDEDEDVDEDEDEDEEVDEDEDEEVDEDEDEDEEVDEDEDEEVDEDEDEDEEVDEDEDEEVDEDEDEDEEVDEDEDEEVDEDEDEEVDEDETKNVKVSSAATRKTNSLKKEPISRSVAGAKGSPLDTTLRGGVDVASKSKGNVQSAIARALVDNAAGASAKSPVARSGNEGTVGAKSPVARSGDEGTAGVSAKSATPSVANSPASTDEKTTSVDAKSAPKSPTIPPKKRRKFRLPTTELLEQATGNEPKIDKDRVLQHATRLEKTLLDYGVSGKVEEIHPGPTVTTYELAPQAGTKVSKVAGLADDLALGLSRKVRIIAPIPGKSRIGFEIPNDQRIPVYLRELVDDPRFAALADKVPLPVVLGRDIVGAPSYGDLASMPHVIVAGATGAGKSVGLNVMLASLLFKRTPDELRMLMIDPKVVELAPFDKIPHLLLPVVTDMKQANLALKWAVDEMERRYQLFATAGTKNIGTYNRWAERIASGELPPPPQATVEAMTHDGAVITVPAAPDGSDGAPNLPGKLPYIVIVIDEFADLMMQQGKEVEASVARLAQKARAAGLHVILATQRPSVDVITGMIKANFPSRIAYLVAQKVDSRTILDEQGAEHLLGRGDMLVKLNGSNSVKRVQCPFISEDEVSALTDYLRTQGQPNYHEIILQADEEQEGENEGEVLDARFEEAVRIVAETGRCSTSWLQRKMTIGYNRAAKIVEAMEKRGMVGPPNGSKDREVLIMAH